MTTTLPPHRSRRTPADAAAFRERILEVCRACIADGCYPSWAALYARGVRGGQHRALAMRDELARSGELGIMPVPERGGRVRLETGALQDQIRELCRDFAATGDYPSLPWLRRKGVKGSSGRIVAARNAVMDELGVKRETHHQSPPVPVQSSRRVGLDPRRERRTTPRSKSEARCWELRKAFWGTEAGRRTRELLRKPSQPEVQS